MSNFIGVTIGSTTRPPSIAASLNKVGGDLGVVTAVSARIATTMQSDVDVVPNGVKSRSNGFAQMKD